MEVRETAACGISERQFAIECESDDLPHIYRILRFAQADDGFIEEEFLDDLMDQMIYICGSEIEEIEEEDADSDSIKWQEGENDTYELIFSETNGAVLYQIFKAVLEDDDEFDKKLDTRLMAEIKELAPSILDNLPVINR